MTMTPAYSSRSRWLLSVVLVGWALGTLAACGELDELWPEAVEASDMDDDDHWGGNMGDSADSSDGDSDLRELPPPEDADEDRVDSEEVEPPPPSFRGTWALTAGGRALPGYVVSLQAGGCAGKATSLSGPGLGGAVLHSGTTVLLHPQRLQPPLP